MSLLEAKNATEKMLSEMQTITRELFEAFKGEGTVYAPLPGCFEHYGLDFLVEDSGKGVFKTYLLEVNPGPDFKQTGSKLREVVKGMLRETVDLVLGGVDYDKKGNGNVFTKVFEERLRGGNAGEVSIKLNE